MTARSGAVSAACLLAVMTIDGQSIPNLLPFRNAAGLVATYNTDNSPIDISGPFFQSLGTNGRSCGSCHRPAQGWSVSAEELRFRFDITAGSDPIFRPVDGANCDSNIDTSTFHGRRKAYSLLINRGLIRVAMAVPDDAEFAVLAVQNPYGCGDAATLSVYRRPLPSTNLRALSTVMWDGRESSPQTGTQKITFATNPSDLLSNLAHQVVSATVGHAQGVAPPIEQQKAIVDFEMKLATAQVFDYRAGLLNGHDATGGPAALGSESLPAFFIGINDPLGGNPRGLPFTSSAFTLFDAWANLVPRRENRWEDRETHKQRMSIARGQALFNSKPIAITRVSGLNDDLNTASIPGTCTTCHDASNVGNHSVSLALNIGIGDTDSPLDLSYLPVITLQNRTTGDIKTTTDPGRALVTGQWKDVGRLKGPILRGLASRAPYFHNGSAKSLNDVLDFYNSRFSIGLTDEEKKDLIAFLNAL